MADSERLPTGRVRGVPVPASAATRRANRVRNWKHGGSAKTVTLSEATEAKLREIHPEAPGIIKAYAAILVDGDLEPRKRIAAQSFAAQEIILRRSVDDILHRGETIEEAMIGPEGDVVGLKLKAHPLLDSVIRLNENLGYTAEQQELTPKSKKEGAVNEAAKLQAEKEARLLGALARIAERRSAIDPALADGTIVAELVEG